MNGKFTMLAKAVVLTVVSGFLFGGIFAAAPPRQSAEAQPTVIAVNAPRVGEAAAVSVPRLVQFNGTLKDAASRPLSGVASVTFAIYAEQDGGTALWSETQNVLADANGHYNVLLGSATAAGVPAELFGTGQSRWLGITVARQQEMPRVLLASVPYALKAGDADTLGGLPASAYVTTQSLAARSTTTPGSTTILTAPQNSAAASQDAAPSALPVSNATPTGSGTTNYIPLWTSASALGNSLLYQTGGNVGIGTTTPAETLDVNGNSIFRGSFQLPPGHPATASSGYESHSFQFQASSYNSSTKASTTQSFGFRAEPLNNNTTNPSAKLDLFFIPNGGSDFVDTGFSFSSTGIVTFAPNQTFPSLTLTGPLNLPSSSGSAAILNIGNEPFLANYGGISNAFFGDAAGGGGETSSAGLDTAIGLESSFHLVSGQANTSVGAYSLVSNVEGNSNTAVGDNALNNTTAGNNTALGAYAGQSNGAGTNNTFVGVGADASMPSGDDAKAVRPDAGSAGLNNATAIGANAIVSASNSMVLGGTGEYAVSVGIGTAQPAFTLEVIDRGLNGEGIAGISAVSGDNAIFGNNTAQSGSSNGGYFTTDSVEGSGVVGVNTAGGLAGYFGGNVQVAGMLSKSSGSFKIDDPIDPSGKYLSHSFVESPDMMNIYNGSVILNAKGEALVTLPAWFDALNRDFQYQLTAIGAPAPRLFIASEIQGNHFKIAGGRNGQKVSWQVTGIRQDAWANAHRIPVEEEKPANEQGHYIHPELFGAGPEQGIGSSAMASNALPRKSSTKP